jgi:hypothetical protein
VWPSIRRKRFFIQFHAERGPVRRLGEAAANDGPAATEIPHPGALARRVLLDGRCFRQDPDLLLLQNAAGMADW